MNDQDLEAFEKWWNNNLSPFSDNDKAFAILAHKIFELERDLYQERERSKMLIEALEVAANATCWNESEDACSNARRVLARYRGEI